ncbi:hypothetical protein, partial [Albidovulum sp.]|uniref:hypothetical protein n=1 Tax=Albidovulum sp. TaxID=1872424 RepID=UPI0039B832CD
GIGEDEGRAGAVQGAEGGAGIVAPCGGHGGLLGRDSGNNLGTIRRDRCDFWQNERNFHRLR